MPPQSAFYVSRKAQKEILSVVLNNAYKFIQVEIQDKILHHSMKLATNISDKTLVRLRILINNKYFKYQMGLTIRCSLVG